MKHERTESESESRGVLGVSEWHARVGVLVFYIALVLLNGEGLLDRASKLEYGTWQRAVSVALAEPLAWVSRTTRLSEVRAMTHRTVGYWLNGDE